MGNCNRCKRPMREQRTPVADAPGTIRVGSNGNCDSCTHFLATTRAHANRTAGTDAVRFATITTRPPAGDWRDAALCAQTDPDAYFPENNRSDTDAKKVCLACDARTSCLEYALERGEEHGIWGGLSERERRKILRVRDRKKADAA